jgi:predicted nucleotidyltransferase
LESNFINSGREIHSFDAGKSIILVNEVDKAVIRKLLYFDIFRHPLSANEIYHFCDLKEVTPDQINNRLQKLSQQGIIYQYGGYYFLSNDKEAVTKRINGNKLAAKYMKKALFISGIIARFPFVRGILVSGSLSKGYMDKGSDIDFFIVTETGRLWLCRSMLATVRKLLIKPLRKYFCINYFIDTSSLEIPDKNIFTATELAFIRPTYNPAIYNNILKSNEWMHRFYPNKSFQFNDIITRKEPSGIKAVIEKILHGKWGEKLDTFMFRFMLRRWKKRYSDFDVEQFDLNIRTRKNVSKQHEKGYQYIILEKYTTKVLLFETKFKVTL